MTTNADVTPYQNSTSTSPVAISLGWVLGRALLGALILAVTMSLAAWLLYQGIDPELEANRLKQQTGPISTGSITMPEGAINNIGNGGVTAGTSVAAPTAAAAAAAIMRDGVNPQK